MPQQSPPQTPPTTTPDWDSLTPHQDTAGAPPPAVNLGPNWDSLSVLQAPKPALGVDPSKPLGGPPSPWMPVIRGAMEIGGAMLGPELLPLKGAAALPSAVRLAWRMATAGAGQAAGGAVADQVTAGTRPPSIGAAVDRAKEDFQGGVVGEGIGAGLSLGGRLARRAAANYTPLGKGPIIGKITPEGKEVVSALGENVRPSSVNPSRIVDILENVFKNSLFGGGRYKALVESEEQGLREYVQKLIGNTLEGAKTKSDAGKFWQAAHGEAEKRAKGITDKLYEDVDALAGDIRVPMDDALQFVRQEGEVRGAVGSALAPGAVKSTSKAVEQAAGAGADVVPGAEHVQAAFANAKAAGDVTRMEQIADIMTEAGIPQEAMQTGMTFRQAREMRSVLGRRMADAKASSDKGARNSYGFLSQLRTRVDDAMTKAAGGKDTPVRKAFDTATDAYRTMAETFYDGILADVAKAKPREVVRKLIVPHEVDDILKARKALGDKNWKPVAATFAEDVFRTSTGELKSGEKVYETLQRYGPETIEAIYGRGTADDLWQVARVMKQVQRKRAGDLSWMIPTAQTTAAVGAAAAGATGTIRGSSAVKGILLLGLPSVMARIALSPTGRQLLTTGLKAKSAGDITKATRLAGQLASWLEKEGLLQRAWDRATRARGAGNDPFVNVQPEGGRGGGPGPIGAGTPPPSTR